MLRYHTEGLKKSVSPISWMAFPSSALEQQVQGLWLDIYTSASPYVAKG